MRERYFHFLRIDRNAENFIDKRAKMTIIICMEANIEQIISKNLIELRKSKNLKQTELSEKIGYSDKTISRWEKGTSIPDITTLVALAEFYDVSLEDLIRENAVKKSSEEERRLAQEKAINDYSMVLLSIMTVWLIATLVYVGLIWFQEMYYWQAFVCAIPASTFLVYRRSKKKNNIKWFNFLLVSMLIISFVSACYCVFIEYNFWQIFFVVIPLEAMSAVSTFLGRKVDKDSKKKTFEF